MTIVGFNFTKIEAEKRKGRSAKVNISNNVAVKSIEDTDLSLGSEKQKAIKFIFEFVSKYEPDIGSIVLTGEVLFLEEAKKIQKIQDDWKKNKKIDGALMSVILNTVLSKSNVQALILSQEVNLPSPIPLPKVKMELSGDKKKV